jgi:hypothetical protein
MTSETLLDEVLGTLNRLQVTRNTSAVIALIGWASALPDPTSEGVAERQQLGRRHLLLLASPITAVLPSWAPFSQGNVLQCLVSAVLS